MTERLLTVTEVRDQLRVDTTEFVQRLARTGELAAIKVGRYWRFEQTDVDEYLNRHKSVVVDPLAQSKASRSRRRRM